jgi:exodeoxyribonuclease VII small subunit
MAKTVSGDSAAAPAESGDSAPLPENYEAAQAELEALVARMEGGSLSLEESLAAYRRGAALVAFCQQQLETVEQQVRVLDGETLKPLPMNSAGTAATESGDDL